MVQKVSLQQERRLSLTFTMFQYTAKEVTPLTDWKLIFSGPFCFVCSFFLTYFVVLPMSSFLDNLCSLSHELPGVPLKKSNASYKCPVVVGRKLQVNNLVTDYFALSSDSVMLVFYLTDRPWKYERRHLVNHTPALLQLLTTLLLFYAFR